ncbi:zinc ribbon domain-containing protein [Acidianus sp. HS-5]|uniref:zinc ribbon domain-containing protein n=1 Tax=Acidianus sp. HS-5 TaxID=2886040 RepID=UPI001F20A23A|nr:zinc ribbon domain-containing protein [Acidianus sp. HS-5]BDC17922.1 hypothetical protein HS5_08120 [Acidianus sp. HS-5]
MVKYCPKCGYPNVDDAKFCLKCGSPLPESYILQGGAPPQSSPQSSPQPPPQPPTSQYPYMPQEPPKKKVPIKAILGGVVAVIVVLVVFLVVLPLISPSHGVYGIASTASSDFGGHWSVAKCKSAVATYVGNGKYEIKYLNGTTEYKKICSIPFGCLSSLISTSGGTYYQPNFMEYPSKISFAVINGTVNGQKDVIVLLGMYWNSTPNIAYYFSNMTKYLITKCSSSIAAGESQAKQLDSCFIISSFNGMYYYYIATSNSTLLSSVSVPYSALSHLGISHLTAIGEFWGATTHEAIIAVTINVAPSSSQIQSIVSEFQSCL